MCGKYVTGSDDLSWRQWVELLRLSSPSPPEPRPARPGSQVSNIVRGEADTAQLVNAVWGLQLSGKLYFNQRMETLLKRFPESARARRCLLPAMAFEVAEGKAGQKNRIRHHVSTTSGAMLLAGFWEPREGELPRVTVLTRAAQGLLASLHERAPVFVPTTLAADWLRTDDPAPLVQRLLDDPDPEWALTAA